MLSKSNIKNIITDQCGEVFHVSAKRPGIYQVSMPFYHEDGDALDIFVESSNQDKVRISDYGMTLMRLSYDYDIDSPNKDNIFNQIVTENRLKEKDGSIYIEVSTKELYPGLLSLASGIAKIGSMKYFKKEVIQNLFYESVNGYVFEKMANFKPESKFHPIQTRTDLEVDYLIETPNRPLYIFAVKGSTKAKMTTICCLTFQNEKLPFTSVIIHENMENLGPTDRSLLTNTVDKQYTNFAAFTENIHSYVHRESSVP